MEIVYYKSPAGNFGDDLNGWLWSRIFTKKYRRDILFLGIGSILSQEVDILKELKESDIKVVFGTGVRYSFFPLEFDHNWHVIFFRGPLSSKLYGNDFRYIADAAYCLRQIENFDELACLDKEYDISFMPHVNSTTYFNWKNLCKECGIHYISPYSENGVEFTIREISKSRRIISEAMHGAIVADALRVPWHRFVLSTPFFEGGGVSEFKWQDWLQSIGLGYVRTTYVKLKRRTILNRLIFRFSFKLIDAQFFLKGVVRKDVVRSFRMVKEYYLSSGEILDRIDKELKKEISDFNDKYSV